MFFSSKKEEAPLQVDITTFECIEQSTFTDTVSLNNSHFNDTEESNEIIKEDNDCNKDEDEDDDDDDDDSEIEDDTENTIYVICVDDVPYSYKRSSQEAKDTIDRMAKLYNLNDIGYHSTLTNYKNENEIELIRNFDFGLFSLNFTMHTFKIFRLNN